MVLGLALLVPAQAQFLQQGGKLIFVGIINDHISLFDPDLHRREATILASRNSTAPEHHRVLELMESGRIVLTGYPVRPEFWEARRAPARAALGVGPEEFLLVVFGGSQGARRINTTLQEALPELLTHVRVIHIGGRRDADVLERCRQALPSFS